MRFPRATRPVKGAEADGKLRPHEAQKRRASVLGFEVVDNRPYLVREGLRSG